MKLKEGLIIALVHHYTNWNAATNHVASWLGWCFILNGGYFLYHWILK